MRLAIRKCERQVVKDDAVPDAGGRASCAAGQARPRAACLLPSRSENSRRSGIKVRPTAEGCVHPADAGVAPMPWSPGELDLLDDLTNFDVAHFDELGDTVAHRLCGIRGVLF